MGRGKQFTDEEEGAVRMGVQFGKTVREIAFNIGKSATAVQNCIKRQRLGVGIVRKGRPSVVSGADRRRLCQKASNYSGSSKKLRSDLDLTFSDRTVRRVLHKCPYLKHKKKTRKPILKAAQIQNRIAWGQAHLQWHNRWKKIVFSDEKKFNNSYYHDERKGELPHNRRHSGGGGVMVWAAIGWSGKTPIAFLQGNQTAIKYQATLQEYLLPHGARIGGPNLKFMQDNASIHRAHTTEAWMQDHQVEVLPWPPRSPDLNPIENVWGKLSQYVYAEGKQFDHIEDLKTAISAGWAQISGEYRHKLYNSMPDRIQEMLNKHGIITLY